MSNLGKLLQNVVIQQPLIKILMILKNQFLW